MRTTAGSCSVPGLLNLDLLVGRSHGRFEGVLEVGGRSYDEAFGVGLVKAYWGFGII